MKGKDSENMQGTLNNISPLLGMTGLTISSLVSMELSRPKNKFDFHSQTFDDISFTPPFIYSRDVACMVT